MTTRVLQVVAAAAALVAVVMVSMVLLTMRATAREDLPPVVRSEIVDPVPRPLPEHPVGGEVEHLPGPLEWPEGSR